MILFYSAYRNNFILKRMYYLRLNSVSSPWQFPLFWVESSIRFFYIGEKKNLMGFLKPTVDIDVLMLAFMII